MFYSIIVVSISSIHYVGADSVGLPNLKNFKETF